MTSIGIASCFEELQQQLHANDPFKEQDLFAEARQLTACRFKRRIVLFAPLYVSNVCVNNCLYCGFRRDNALLERRVLSSPEVQAEAKVMAAMGHQTVLIVAGEHPEYAGSRAIAQDILTVRAIPGIRDVKVEVMPMTGEGYRQLYEAGARGVVLYQETYDRNIYSKAHPCGPKAAFEWRLTAMERALQAGFRQIGLGILLGLREPTLDLWMLIAHARSIHARWGFWPSTVSLPRLQPAQEAPWSIHPPHPVSDENFLRLVALLRLALPEVGMTLSTRECPEVRDRLLEMGIGITHLSAGSRTSVGGYTQDSPDGLPAEALGRAGQFAIQDERSPSEVAKQLKNLGYEPVWA